MKNFIVLISLLFLVSCQSKEDTRPNVIVIYADDMGYGDLACQNAAGKILTPNLDRLASEGMRFTDAHSSSGICSPSRYALLSGQYHWRRRHDIITAFGKPFFSESDISLPQVLRDNGYQTAAIGKWHLGFNWDFINDKPSGASQYKGNTHRYYLPEDLDWNQRLSGGPNDRGFDYYFGDGTINFPPYAWMENNHFVENPNSVMKPREVGFEVKEGRWEFRSGPKVEGWNPYIILPTLTSKVKEYILDQKKGNPFFLYFSLPSPHAPIIPNYYWCVKNLVNIIK